MEDKYKEYGQSNFDLPHDVVQLPSGGIFYKNKKKAVKVGYLTAADENLLLGNSKNFTLQLLKNKIYEYDIRPEDMIESDIEAILIFLRNTSFGSDIELSVTDPKTGKSFKATVDLGELSIEPGNKPNEDGTYTVTLPKSGDVVKLKPLTYGEILEVNDIIENYPPSRIAPKVTLRLSREIVEINGDIDKTNIVKYVETMPIADSKFIRRYLTENEPKLNMKKDIKTPSGDVTTVNAGFGVEFFRPFFGL
jgi:hypothetical protein